MRVLKINFAQGIERAALAAPHAAQLAQASSGRTGKVAGSRPLYSKRSPV